MQEWDKKHGTMRHYDCQAKVYDAQYLEEQNAKIGSALKTVELRSNELVLDIGCGTGFLFHHIDNAAKLLVGLDISQKALQIAKKRTKSMSNTVLIRADADYTPFLDQTFDRIFAVTLLQNMPDPAKTISEIKRISTSETVFVLTGLKKKFTQEGFVSLLNRAQLKLSTTKTGEHLKGYVAVCRKLGQSV
jgi:ubiquinone/menaquinone biosynthesis C-methylase UbiE